MSSESLTVRDLRRQWKPHKESLGESPTNVRFHRACSWIQRAEKGEDDLDFALLSHWIAFNALYGQWDMAIQEPLADRECWRCFLDRMMERTHGGKASDTLLRAG